ncbi:MAG: hypothetical protein R6U38_03635 [Desulfatiglandaceae bacterium]
MSRMDYMMKHPESLFLLLLFDDGLINKGPEALALAESVEIEIQK